MDSRFSMIPLAALLHPDLTFRTLKVYGAICSFRKDSADFCVEAGRDEIASRCGFNASIVSTATTELQRLGWLIKQGAGGRIKGGCGLKTTYTILTPETVAFSETVAESETVLKSETVTENKTVLESTYKTVSDSGTPLYIREVKRDISISAPNGFDEFWDVYAKKVGRAAAIDRWKKLKPNADLVRLMITAAKRYSASTEQQFRKDPERWIKDRRWEDEPAESQSADAEDSLFENSI